MRLPTWQLCGSHRRTGPKNLTVEVLGKQPLSADKLGDPAHTVIWLEDAAADMSEPQVRAAQAAVQAGATLLWSGKSMPLLAAYGSWTGGKPVAEASPRPDIVFEDFEHGYDNWQVTGEAFGKEPAKGTLPNQQQVSGFLGQGLVNTYLGGDDTTGRLISKSVHDRAPVHTVPGRRRALRDDSDSAGGGRQSGMRDLGQGQRAAPARDVGSRTMAGEDGAYRDRG